MTSQKYRSRTRSSAVYRLINMFMNLKGAAQSEVLKYNYLIVGVAVVAFVLNMILKKSENNLQLLFAADTNGSTMY